jgi:hypothetical protein
MEARDDAHAEGSSSHPFAPVAGRKWSLTQEAFDRFLSHLDPDRETAGRKYLEVRSNLFASLSGEAVHFPKITLTRQSTGLPDARLKGKRFGTLLPISSAQPE